MTPLQALEAHAAWGLPLTLTPAQCAEVLARLNALVEAKNQVVRDNHALRAKVLELANPAPCVPQTA